jgi:hypothetical protein
MCIPKKYRPIYTLKLISFISPIIIILIFLINPIYLVIIEPNQISEEFDMNGSFQEKVRTISIRNLGPSISGLETIFEYISNKNTVYLENNSANMADNLTIYYTKIEKIYEGETKYMSIRFLVGNASEGNYKGDIVIRKKDHRGNYEVRIPLSINITSNK